jgi:hypothetical protein
MRPNLERQLAARASDGLHDVQRRLAEAKDATTTS